MPADGVELPRHGDRADRGVVVEADLQLPCPGAEPLDELVGDLRRDVDAFDADAGLPRVGASAEDRGIGSGVEVGIGIDDHRVLAAALGHQRCQRLSTGGHDLLGGGGGADEGDLVYARAAQRGAGVTQPVHDLQHRLLGDHLGEPLGQPLAHARRVLAGLVDHRVAGSQRVGHQ
jgi:hypothetical protein